MNRETDIAWLAGLYEGEGCVYRGARHVTLSIKMVDEDVIRRAQVIAGCGSVRGPYWHGKHARQQQWTWAVSRRNDVIALIESMRPWLGTRRLAQAAAQLDGLEPLPEPRQLIEPAGVCDYVGLNEASSRGAKRHVRRGERPCSRCAVAQRRYLRAWRRAFFEANP